MQSKTLNGNVSEELLHCTHQATCSISFRWHFSHCCISNAPSFRFTHCAHHTHRLPCVRGFFFIALNTVCCAMCLVAIAIKRKKNTQNIKAAEWMKRPFASVDFTALQCLFFLSRWFPVTRFFFLARFLRRQHYDFLYSFLVAMLLHLNMGLFKCVKYSPLCVRVFSFFISKFVRSFFVFFFFQFFKGFVFLLVC